MHINIDKLKTHTFKIVIAPTLAILLGLTSAANLAADTVQVFACEPEWASLAEEIGGSKVKTFSATHAQQNPHFIRARPSLIAKVRKTDLIFCSGAGLEVGWLPILIQKAGASLQPGNNGYLMAGDYVQLIEQPHSHVDRSMGDIHPEGNPHVHMDPRNILIVAKELTKRLSSLDQGSAEYYAAQFGKFSKRWSEALSGWEKEISDLAGHPVITHHKSFSYFNKWAKLNEVGSIEPKPGLPPTIRDLNNLYKSIKDIDDLLIIRSPFDPAKGATWLGEKTSRPAIVMPYTIGGNAKVTDLFSLFDESIRLIKSTL